MDCFLYDRDLRHERVKDKRAVELLDVTLDRVIKWQKEKLYQIFTKGKP